MGSREKRIDHASLSLRVRVGDGVPRLNAPAPAAGKLASRIRGALDDGRDLLERDVEDVVQKAETRPSDRADAVPDDVWKEASRHFAEPALAALVTAIAVANLWNRLNVTTRQVTGDWIAQYI